MEISRFLPFWAANMLFVRSGKLNWFGFRYSEREWQRFEKLAESVSPGLYMAFVLVNAVLFIIMAGLLLGLIMVPVIQALYPDPSQLSALVFFPLLGVIIMVCLGIGLPLTMAASAAMLGKPSKETTHEDHALVRKVRWQITRMGLFVTALAFALIGVSLAFGIDLEPGLRAAISIISFATSALTLFLILRRR